jgi:ubiquinone/menaquinone biosynthesis C-methylase UbiE
VQPRETVTQPQPVFDNPFQIEDIAVFDDEALCHVLSSEYFGITPARLGQSLHGASPQLVERVIECGRNCLSPVQRDALRDALQGPCSPEQITQARQQLLDQLFWELTYWKTPELYEALTAGEQLHPGIFQQLEPDIRGKVVLDVGAGSGRATLECVKAGAALVYAIEPSPGLLRILQRKCAQALATGHMRTQRGRFDALPLPDASVDTAISCSAFTAADEQGGKPGLAELRRVTKDGGKIILIWPRREDYAWLLAHGFTYVTLPAEQNGNEEPRVHFHSLQSAWECVERFYAHNTAVTRYLRNKQRLELPFSVLGVNPPHDYCWLTVTH